MSVLWYLRLNPTGTTGKLYKTSPELFYVRDKKAEISTNFHPLLVESALCEVNLWHFWQADKHASVARESPQAKSPCACGCREQCVLNNEC